MWVDTGKLHSMPRLARVRFPISIVRQHDVLRLDTVVGVRQRLLYILKTPVFIASKPLTKIIVLATQPMNHIAVFIMKIGGATVKA